MDGTLLVKALMKFVAGVLVLGLLLFLPAGTLGWWQGWLLMAIMFIAAFVVAGLGHRLGWPCFPTWASWAGAVVFLASYGFYAEVMRENAYLSRTVEVQEGQKVIDTGLYGIVRHPMYSATLLLFLSMPIVLGSPFAFVIMLAYLPIIAKRIRNEEEVLTRGLRGYREYKRRVRWRLIPHVW